MPAWAQDLAALTAVGLAAAWLIARWFQIGQPRASQVGCARCDHNPRSPSSGARSPASPGRGVRSNQLRVLD